MKKEEKSYLKGIKHSGGMDYDKAEEEIQKLENSQKQFKILNINLKKKDTKIRNLEKQVEKLKEKIEKWKIKGIKEAPKPNIKKRSNLGKIIFSEDMLGEEREKVTKWKKYMNRIYYNIEEDRTYTKTDIVKGFFVPGYVFDWAINGLIKKGVIGVEETFDGTRYYKK